MYVDPTKYELLLVGPRVAQLKPFFDARAYRTDPVVAGRDGLQSLEERERHLVVLELNLGDMRASEFVSEARQTHPNLRVILLENADRAGQIVKALVHGIDAYVPTPPDEQKLFAEVERQLLGFASSQLGEDGVDLQETLNRARSEVSQLQMQNDLVRQELTSAQEELSEAQHALAQKAQSAEGNADEVAALLQQVETLQERADKADIVELELRNLGVDDDNLLDGIRWVGEQLSALGEANVAAAMSKATADDLQAELEKAREDIEALKAAEAALQETLSQNAELQQVADQVTALTEERDALAKDLDAARASVESLQAGQSEHAEKLQSELDTKVAEIERLSADIAQADQEAEQRAEELRSAAAAKSSVEQELAALAESLQAKHAEIVARDEALAAKDQQLAALSAEIERLNHAVATANERALEAAKPQIDAKLAEVEGDRQKLAEERAEAERLQEEAEDRLLVVDVEIDELRAKIAELEEKLAAAEIEVRDERRKRVEERELGSSTGYAQQIEELLAELKQVKAERDAAKGIAS